MVIWRIAIAAAPRGFAIVMVATNKVLGIVVMIRVHDALGKYVIAGYLDVSIRI